MAWLETFFQIALNSTGGSRLKIYNPAGTLETELQDLSGIRQAFGVTKVPGRRPVRSALWIFPPGSTPPWVRLWPTIALFSSQLMACCIAATRRCRVSSCRLWTREDSRKTVFCA